MLSSGTVFDSLIEREPASNFSFLSVFPVEISYVTQSNGKVRREKGESFSNAKSSKRKFATPKNEIAQVDMSDIDSETVQCGKPQTANDMTTNPSAPFSSEGGGVSRNIL